MSPLLTLVIVPSLLLLVSQMIKGDSKLEKWVKRILIVLAIVCLILLFLLVAFIAIEAFKN
jgi:ABC-type phosphate transport system permease subunit